MNSQTKSQQIEFEVFPKDNKNSYSYLSGIKNDAPHETRSVNIVFSTQSIIIICICVLMLLVASFSLGVEKGKLIPRNIPADDKITESTVPVTPPVPAAPAPLKSVNQAIEKTPAAAANLDNLPLAGKIEASQNNLPVETTKITVPKKGFTIQIATVNTKESARTLCDALAKKGIAAYAKPSGKYMIVLAGDFASKAEAAPQLKELKKTYTDCYIKKT